MQNQPNVLLICTDHWSSQLFSGLDHSAVMTPTLDTLANTGIRYTNMYSECPVCIPARRTLMTGLSPKSHGDRVYSDRMQMPEAKTLAQVFSDNGYQTFAVGKLHVYPQRDRIGFDDVILEEEGRYEFGIVDDYQHYLGEQGYGGQQFLHGMGNNTYYTRPWHLPEEYHVTNWATREMIKTIKRKDPTRPAFYYMSYSAPHPPLVPLKTYMDMYKDVVDEDVVGSWIDDDVYPIKALKKVAAPYSQREKTLAKQAFYALCTHVDHQIRLLIGTLKEEGLLDNTIIGFVSDHGDMLFNHKMVAKRVFYEQAAHIPFILTGQPLQAYAGQTDDRLMCLADVMPTLLDLAKIDIPKTVEGHSAFSNQMRSMLYGEISEDALATRMVHDGQHKLIYYPVDNYMQLFDLKKDPKETENLSQNPAYQDVKKKLTEYMLGQLNKEDKAWVQDGCLVGIKRESVKETQKIDYSLKNQRGGHWPQPKI